MSYAYLFKYIIIGDTGKFFLSLGALKFENIIGRFGYRVKLGVFSRSWCAILLCAAGHMALGVSVIFTLSLGSLLFFWGV